MTGKRLIRFAEADMIASFIFTGFMVVALWAAMQLTGIGRVFPIYVTIVATTLGIIDGIISYFRFRGTAMSQAVEGNKDVGVRELAALAWPVLLVSLIYIFGFVIAIPIFVAIFMLQRKNIEKRYIFAMAFIFTGITYFIFEVILSARLHVGIIWEWII